MSEPDALPGAEGKRAMEVVDANRRPGLEEIMR